MSNAVSQDVHRVSQLLLAGRFLAESSDLSIEQFDHWTNPSGLSMGASIYCRAEACEDAA